ncbi:hypothetical protein RJT34_18269 [Clitoria ternatea]|uniref:Uncharacterized protein n=1 Tax=Clitoria ternatea TaxID=43366 RepID=A0AAN9JAH1_CLITE
MMLVPSPSHFTHVDSVIHSSPSTCAVLSSACYFSEYYVDSDRILQWRFERRSKSFNKKGNFARLVRSKRFVLIFHELSMTGAPLSIMELATELLSCGAYVSAVVLSKKGGLMQELARRQIKVLEDKASVSFKIATKTDLVIAGSTVCGSWISTV